MELMVFHSVLPGGTLCHERYDVVPLLPFINIIISGSCNHELSMIKLCWYVQCIVRSSNEMEGLIGLSRF